MAEWRNSWETGVANGTAVTVANSDDGGESAIDASDVTGAAGGAGIVYDTSVFYRGTRSMRARNGTTPGNASAQCGGSLNILSNAPSYMAGRFLIVGSLPPDATGSRLFVPIASDQSFQGEVRLTSAGVIRVVDRLGASAILSTTVFAPDTWYEIKVAVLVFSATVGQFELKVINIATGATTESITSAASFNNLSVGGLHKWKIGNARNHATRDIHWDDCAISDTGYPVLDLLTTTLVVADSQLSLQSDAVTLTQQHNLAVADSLLSLTSESPTLTQLHNLSVADSRWTLNSDSPTLTQAHTLAVADSRWTLASESPTLTQQHLLSVADSLLSLTSDSPTLVLGTVTLTVADSLFSFRSDVVGLIIGNPETPEERIYAIEFENRVYTVAADASRISTVDSEDRLTIVSAEERQYVIPGI